MLIYVPKMLSYTALEGTTLANAAAKPEEGVKSFTSYSTIYSLLYLEYNSFKFMQK